MSNFTQIADAVERLSYAFREAGMAAPEIIMQHDDLTRLRAMASPHLMAPDYASRHDKLCGVIMRTERPPQMVYTYVTTPTPSPAPPQPE